MRKWFTKCILCIGMLLFCSCSSKKQEAIFPGIDFSQYTGEDMDTIIQHLKEESIEYEVETNKGYQLVFIEGIDEKPFEIHLEFSQQGERLYAMNKIAYFPEEQAEFYIDLQSSVYEKMEQEYKFVNHKAEVTEYFFNNGERLAAYNYYWFIL